MPHKDFGEAVTAIIVSKSNKFDSSKIIADLSESLAKYKIPKILLRLMNYQETLWEKFKKIILGLNIRIFIKMFNQLITIP